MERTSGGRFRVLASTRDDDELVLLDPETADPYYVPTTGYEGGLADSVAGLRPGYLVAADFDWDDGTPRFASVTVESPTLFTFVDGADVVFEAARETWDAARAAGEGMNATVTRDTDGAENGVIYTFAEQPGEQDLFAEFQDGIRPLDPLLARLAEGADPPFEVFVIRPTTEPFVVVAITMDKAGLFADTMRDTYDCPRPDEPLV